MLDFFKTRNEMRRKAGEIYGVIVTRARVPDFYLALGVPDTPTGRYEMVVLHLILVLERLRASGGEGSELSRLLVETFVADMDDSLRELGTGDLSVPKKVRRAAAGLYERSLAYRSALEAADEVGLARLLVAHVYGGSEHPGAASLARYAMAASSSLGTSGAVEPLALQCGFPPLAGPAGEAA